MKTTVISMVRNEGDVIEAFVRHHSEFADEIIVVDHRSADATGEILRALAAEGLPLKVRQEQSLVHRQNVVMTGLMREAVTVGGADWVLPLDADEFLLAPEGQVRESLASLPREQPIALDTLLYVPTPEEAPEEPHVLRRIQRRRELDNHIWTRKVVVPARPARNPCLSLAQGNHGLVDPRTRRFAPAGLTDRLVVAHFPVRSGTQIARKILGGWPAYLARPDRVDGGNPHWNRTFELLVHSRRLTARRLEALAFDYATPGSNGDRGRELIFDPVPADFELRYPVGRGPTPLETLAGTAVQLAEELSAALGEGGDALGRSSEAT